MANIEAFTFGIKDLSLQHQEVVKVTVLCSSTLSLLGSLFVVLSYIIFPSLRTFRLKMIFMMSLTDLGTSTFWYLGILGVREDDSLCVGQAFGLQFFVFAGCLWTSCFAFTLYCMWMADKRVKEYEKYYHVISWGLPLAICLWLYFSNAFGPAGPWCWIRGERSYYRLTYLLIIFLVVVNAALYVRIAVGVRLDLSRMHPNDYASAREYSMLVHEHRVQRHFLLYIIAFIITQVPGFINRVHDSIEPENRPLYLYIFQAATEPMQGFFNCLLYLINKKIVKQYKVACCCGMNESKIVMEDEDRTYYEYAGEKHISDFTLPSSNRTDIIASIPEPLPTRKGRGGQMVISDNAYFLDTPKPASRSQSEGQAHSQYPDRRASFAAKLSRKFSRKQMKLARKLTWDKKSFKNSGETGLHDPLLAGEAGAGDVEVGADGRLSNTDSPNAVRQGGLRQSISTLEEQILLMRGALEGLHGSARNSVANDIAVLEQTVSSLRRQLVLLEMAKNW